MNNKLQSCGRNLAALYISFALILIPGLVQAAILEEARYSIETRYKKNDRKRSKAEVSIKSHPVNKNMYHLVMRGQGDFGGFQNINWVSQADLFEQGGNLLVLKSSSRIFSKDKLKVQFDKNYDYKSKTALWEKRNEKNEVVSTEKFPIKGPICDDVTMVYVFNKIITPQGDGVGQKFYLLTNEPKLYHVMIKLRGEEKLNDLSGSALSDKFQLMADLGPLTELAAKMVPPTYVWLEKSGSRQWIKYEGMETGYETENVVTFVFDQETKASL